MIVFMVHMDGALFPSYLFLFKVFHKDQKL